MLTCALLLILGKGEAFKVRFQASSDQLMLCERRSTLSWVVKGERQPAPSEQGGVRLQGFRKASRFED